MKILKVSSKSEPSKVAGAIALTLKEQTCVWMIAIGAGAVNQAIKAVTVARGFVAPSGKELAVIPSFEEVLVDGKEKSSVKMKVIVL